MINYFSYQKKLKKDFQQKLVSIAMLAILAGCGSAFFYVGCCVDNEVQLYSESLPLRRVEAQLDKQFCFLKCSDYILGSDLHARCEQ